MGRERSSWATNFRRLRREGFRIRNWDAVLRLREYWHQRLAKTGEPPSFLVK